MMQRQVQWKNRYGAIHVRLTCISRFFPIFLCLLQTLVCVAHVSLALISIGVMWRGMTDTDVGSGCKALFDGIFESATNPAIKWIAILPILYSLCRRVLRVYLCDAMGVFCACPDSCNDNVGLYISALRVCNYISTEWVRVNFIDKIVCFLSDTFKSAVHWFEWQSKSCFEWH